MTIANVTSSVIENNSTKTGHIKTDAKQEKVINHRNDKNLEVACDTEEISQTNPKNSIRITLNNKNSLLPIIANTSSNSKQLHNKNNDNTVLKYVYNNKINSAPEKQKTNFKNSLRRKKRSQEEPQLEHIKEVPANFEYSTVHNPKEREDLQDWQTKPTLINRANLADFNIETLHVHEGVPFNINLQKDSPSMRHNFQSNTQGIESSESREEQNSKSLSKKKSPSAFQKSHDSNERSEELEEDLNIAPVTSETYDVSRENIKIHPKKSINDESSEEKDVQKFISSDESKEDNVGHIKPNSNTESFDEDLSREIKPNFSDDSKEHNNFDLSIPIPNINQKNIHNIDIGDQEKNQNLNENTPIENSSLYINPIESYNKAEKTKDDIPRTDDLNRSSEIDSYEDKQPISINDEEVRPVIEINSESSEESNDKSLESTNSRLINDDNTNKDLNLLLDKTKGDAKTDVKQEFERIPLNYNHDAEKINNSKINNLKDIISIENDESIQTTSKYDENLNFKFSDVAVTLPEIKLPEDILDYAIESDSASDNDQESNDHSKDSGEKSTEKIPVYYDDFSSFIKNDFDNNRNAKSQKSKYNDYNDKNSDDEDEYEDDDDDDDDDDLYEKFVRERFGKKGSFQKRSEKLVKTDPIVENRKLYKTLHNVLKKTQEIEKEADKNGKPKADYLWTLEYGQKLP